MFGAVFTVIVVSLWVGAALGTGAFFVSLVCVSLIVGLVAACTDWFEA